MRTDSRLPRVLHVLLHLAQNEIPLTSEQIGKMLGTNPSLVRRMMAGLREAGFVGSTKGHGGGWYLSRPLGEISLADVYKALGSPPLFAMGPSDTTSTCLLEHAANEATRDALDAASAVFQQKLASITVADLTEPYADIIKSFQKDIKIC